MTMSRGEPSSPVWVVAEYPSVADKRNGHILSGAIGHTLREMLLKAGISEDQCYFTHVCPHYQQKPFTTKTQHLKLGYLPIGDKYVNPRLAAHREELRSRIRTAVQTPAVIFALGELSLFSLTDQTGVSGWRGSEIPLQLGLKRTPIVIPTYDIEVTQRMYEWSFLATQDFRRGASIIDGSRVPRPRERFCIRPEFGTVKVKLEQLIGRAALGNRGTETPLRLGVDIETRFGHITCIGIAEGPTNAMCIPLTCHGKPEGYWTREQEGTIVGLLKQLLTHPKVISIGQNFPYDIQYMARHWGFIPANWDDTMTAWHVAYPGLQKSLAFICSMLLPGYIYWKEEGKGHAPDPDKEDQYWTYNCKDAARTLELWDYLTRILTARGMQELYEEQLYAQRPHLKMMFRGVNQNRVLKGQYAGDLIEAIAQQEIVLSKYTDALTGGVPLTKNPKTAKPWYRSPKQLAKILYDIFKLPVQKDRSTRKPTTKDVALTKLMEIEPLFKPLLTKIIEYRSMGVFLSTFVQAKLDWDGRMRSSYSVGGAETFRDTSSEDAFGYGGNLQNIPKGNELEDE
jgi:uracil-DNA glycosylase